MNKTQKMKMMEATQVVLDNTAKYTENTIWMLIWSIVDPSPFQSDEYKKVSYDVLVHLIGMPKADEVLNLMEGAKLKDHDEVVGFSHDGF